MLLAVTLQRGNFIFVGYVDFRGDHEHWLFFQVSAEAGQFPENHFHIFHNIVTAARIGHIDQMNQQPRALDVPQELRAQA